MPFTSIVKVGCDIVCHVGKVCGTNDTDFLSVWTVLYTTGEEIPGVLHVRSNIIAGYGPIDYCMRCGMLGHDGSTSNPPDFHFTV